MALADFPDPSTLPARSEMPDPLVMLDGSRDTSLEQWSEKRRPELKTLFQHYMYGWMPAGPSGRLGRSSREGSALPRRQGDQEGSDDRDCPVGDQDPLAPGRSRTKRDGRRCQRSSGLNFYGNHTALARPDRSPWPTDVWMPPSRPGGA